MNHRWIQAWLWLPMPRKRNGQRTGHGISLSIPALRELRRQVDERLSEVDAPSERVA